MMEMGTKTENTKRNPPDRSPQKDIGNAIDSLANGRAKLIRLRDEPTAAKVLEVIQMLEPLAKVGAGAPS
jgi:hypothetical protein